MLSKMHLTAISDFADIGSILEQMRQSSGAKADILKCGNLFALLTRITRPEY